MVSDQLPASEPVRPARPLFLSLAAWFTLIVAFSCGVVGTLTYVIRSDALTERISDHLVRIRDDKIREVDHWLIDCRHEVEIWSKNPVIVDTLRRHAAGQKLTEQDVSLLNLEQLRQAYHCHSISLMDAATGAPILSTEWPSPVVHELPELYRKRALAERQTINSNVFVCPIHGQPTMLVTSPVRAPESGDVLGLLSFYLELPEYFYPEVLRWKRLGETGEILLVDQEGLVQSPLLFRKDAPGLVRIDAEPPRRGAAGRSGVFLSKDYRDVPVLAAYGYLPQAGWGIVVKQDYAEIIAPVQQMGIQIVLVTLGAIVLATLVSFLIASRIASPAVDIARAAEEAGDGNMNVRAKPTGPREIQTIAENLNNMIDRLGERLRMGRALGEIYAAAGAHSKLDELVAAVMPAIMNATRSQVGAFYLLEEGDDTAPVYQRLSAIGVPVEQVAQKFRSEPPDHLLAGAVVERQVQVIDGLSDQIELRISTQTGSTPPRALMAVPLVQAGRVIAVIGLAALRDYRPEDVEVAGTLSLSLGQSIEACQANERNLRITEELRINNEQLSAANEELQSQTQELAEQAEELRQQSEQLVAQQAAIEESDRLKSQFLSNMSHELRTPLNSIMALSQLMMARGTGVDPEKESEYLRIMERNGRHLLMLINDILDLSKIESGRMEVSPVVFKAEEVVQAAIETTRPLAEAKGLGLEAVFEKTPALFTDREKIRQILLNLLSNAVKFTEAGSIKVNVTTDGGNVVFAVRDTGIGMNEQDLACIFDEFRQVDGSTTRRHEGTGLGLAIGRKLARLIGGDISVQSAVGQGSTFMLSIPLCCPSGPQDDKRRPQAKEGSPAARRVGNGKTVLVVDDDTAARGMLRAFLMEAGYHVLTASNGREAVELARRVRPYAITLDVLMPDMDGWEVIRELKADPRTERVPILVISVADDRATALALGASGFMLKPVAQDRLVAEISRTAGPRPIRRVLVVDDDESARDQLKMILAGHEEVLAAESGAQALEMARQYGPDAIVLDLMMPDMDGFTVLDRLREDPLTRDIPVLILTAKDLSADEQMRLKNAVRKIMTKGRMDPNELFAELERTLAELASAAAAVHGTVLVVDDDEVAATQISLALEEAGYQVLTARSGSQALKMAGQLNPDAMVLDLMMPDMDGFEVLRQVRSNPRLETVPVLILTAKEITPAERLTLDDGRVQQLVQKGSVDRDELVARVGQLLAPPLLPVPAPGSPEPFESPRSSETSPDATPPAPAEVNEKPVSVPADNVVPPSHRGKALILVVEDNPDNLFTIRALLDDLGYQHVHAMDGEQAVRMTRELRPDLVLMDMQLPVLSGFDATRRIKSDAALARIPVVALTAKAMRGDREKILGAGCEAYLAKPIDRRELVQVLTRYTDANP